MRNSLAVLALFLGGCDLYLGDDDCRGVQSGGGALYPNQQLRDPLTGQCQDFGYTDCNNACAPCPGTGIAQPDWGVCYGNCSGLDEQSCFATAGCYASYFDDPAADGKRDFWGCWNTAPSGPVEGNCTNLGAYQCSQHDDCIALYAGTQSAAQFEQCAAEPATYCQLDADCGTGSTCDHTTCYPCPECPTCGACPPDTCYGICVATTPKSCTNVDCGAGYHCEDQCSPGTTCGAACVSDLTCATVDCGSDYSCAETCTPDGNGIDHCAPACVPLHDPGACSGPITCASPAPACPSGTTPGVRNGCYTGYCIPLTDCGPTDPGLCTGTVTCSTAAPQCPSGTVAGIKNGCWSGYCIPQTQCALAACPTLATEMACIARGDCVPVYDGANCTCYPDHCECQTLTYARCETR